MEGIFAEFENENELRNYPFAGGCTPIESEASIPTGIFIDAVFYPINPSGTLYLSSVSAEGVFSISDDSGVIMTGSPSGKTIEFYDLSSFHRHVGTLVSSSEDVLVEFAGLGFDREFPSSYTTFASACVFPVVIDGVISVAVGEAGAATGEVAFSNSRDDVVRVSSGIVDGKNTLRFDIIPRKIVPDESFIKRVICVVDGQTPFRIKKSNISYNTIILTLDSIDKDTVCSYAHRENSFEMADTCGDDKGNNGAPKYIPEIYQLEEVFISPDETGEEGGLSNGADNAFYLIVPNVSGYINPLSITLEDGIVSPKLENPEVTIDGMEANLVEGASIDNMTSKGVILQVPGLSGGQI